MLRVAGFGLWVVGYTWGLLRARQELEVQRDPTWRQILGRVAMWWGPPFMLVLAGAFTLAFVRLDYMESILMALFFWYGVRFIYANDSGGRRDRWGRRFFLASVTALGPLFGLLVWSGR